MKSRVKLDAPPGVLTRITVALLRLFWRVRSRPVGAPKRVLIVRPDRRVGNLLITTALVRSLRKHLPEARVDLVVPKDRAAMLSGLAEVGALHSFDQRDWLQPWRLLRWARRLRRHRYDLVIDASHWHAHSHATV